MWQTALQHVTVLVAWLGTNMYSTLLPIERSLVHSIHSLISNTYLNISFEPLDIPRCFVFSFFSLLLYVHPSFDLADTSTRAGRQFVTPQTQLVKRVIRHLDHCRNLGSEGIPVLRMSSENPFAAVIRRHDACYGLRNSLEKSEYREPRHCCSEDRL